MCEQRGENGKIQQEGDNMKIQDLVFMGVLLALMLIKKRKLFVLTGLLFLVLAMPLFYFHIFFTAERLTWYAGGMFLIVTLYLLFNKE